jgi:hypothetical protein
MQRTVQWQAGTRYIWEKIAKALVYPPGCLATARQAGRGPAHD